ncbi:MAG: MopE-related protein [Polyangiales bacterium]
MGACAVTGALVCGSPSRRPATRPLPSRARKLCSGLDDDCDGDVDDGLGLGDACTSGLGICAAAGVVTCDGAGATVCDAVPGMAGVETCSGLDDDCDGMIDDGFDVGSGARSASARVRRSAPSRATKRALPRATPSRANQRPNAATTASTTTATERSTKAACRPMPGWAWTAAPTTAGSATAGSATEASRETPA